MPLPPRDPDHWLYRLTPEEWLRAAAGELVQAASSLSAQAQRRGVASARRAAGMALNAVLVVAPCEAWGRSYMDHLRALAADATTPAGLRRACAELLEAPLDGPKFVRIGGGADEGAAAAARVVLEWCAERVADAAAATDSPNPE